MSPRTQGSLIGLWLSALLVGGCGGSNFSNGVYEDEEAKYHLGTPPPAWQRIDLTGQLDDLAWRHEPTGAVIQVSAHCDSEFDIPLTHLTNHLLIGFTDRVFTSQEEVSLDGREAQKTHLRAKLDGVPREMLLYVIKKNGCVYDFALAASPGQRFATTRPDFERMLGGFRTMLQ